LQSSKRISTTKQFTITGKDYYAEGTGMEADETFSDYEMKHVSVIHEPKK